MFSVSKQRVPTTLVGRVLFLLQRRNKSKKEHWAALRRKKTSTMRALDHFDDFYVKVFGRQWPSIRVALLSPHKYCAVVNYFGDVERTVTYLENQGAISIKSLLKIEKQPSSEEECNQNKDNLENSELNEKIQKLASMKRQQETEELYPLSEEGVQHAQNLFEKYDPAATKSSKISSAASYSLERGRETAQIDENRYISPSVGLSAGSLYEFVPATKLKGLEDRVLDSDHYNYYSPDSDFPVTSKKELDFNYPTYWNVFMYERGSVLPFESPRQTSTGVLNYYLMDGASIFPVIALGIEAGDKVLDMCAAPGGKSLLMLQSLLTGHLTCNDVQQSRVNRINSVLNQYIFDLPKWKNSILVTKCDGRAILDEGIYDKVLVDVPCTTDRHSLREDDNSIFNPSRIKERLRLPELQSDLLMNALKLVRPGGTVVYSTCSLSPVQNDGVVHMALRKIWEETKIEVEVRDMSPALECAKTLFKFGDNVGLRYGHLMIPFLPCNFGPLYFCKLVRTK